jgi:ribosomal protein S18 acetylase RimI-like enzyme
MPGSAWQTGPLAPDELADVVAIDAAITGRDRGAFFARRLTRTLAAPKRFVHVGLRRDGRLAGFALARLMDGEFGATGRDAALDAIGVHPDHAEAGGGRALMAAFLQVLARKGVDKVVTEVDWEARGLMDFLAHSGFGPAESLVVERAVPASGML